LIKKDKKLTTVNLHKRIIHFSFIALSILLVSACTGLGKDNQKLPTLFTDFNETAEYLLQKAEEVNEPAKTQWQLTAIQALTKEGKYVLADSVIEHLQTKTLSIQQKNHLLLLIAENQYAQNKLDQTLETVSVIDSSVLSEDAKLRFLKLKTTLHVRNKEHQQAVDALLQLTPMVTSREQKQYYNDLLLTQLSMLPANVLNQFSATQVTTEQPLTDEQIFVQGWYSLGSVYQRYQLRTNQLLSALETWETIYPTHPVVDFMPSQLSNIPKAIPYQPNNIAVLLPLTGRFRKPAQALQYGISDAFYNQAEFKKQQFQEESSQETSYVNNVGDVQDNQATPDIVITDQFMVAPPHLRFFDTNAMTMQQIADQLHNENIDFVIGPLLKPNLERFLPLVKDIPVLALNNFPINEKTGETPKTSEIHYAFPLSPEGEAQQAAELIFQNKHKKPLLFAPNSDFGKRASAAFEARWKELSEQQKRESGNTLESFPAETHLFEKNEDYGKFLASALQTDLSKQRISQMRSVLGRKLESEVRSRRDVDAIYIISKRRDLIFIKPFLSVTLSPFASEIPLYASSRSHEADLTNTQDKELNGLTFSDVTFLVDENSQVNQKLQTIWPKQRFSTLRLFALGYDSYKLIEQLKQLQVIEGYQYQGLVGELTLDYNNTVNSKLAWATYQDGALIEVTTPISSQ